MKKQRESAYLTSRYFAGVMRELDNLGVRFVDNATVDGLLYYV